MGGKNSEPFEAGIGGRPQSCCDVAKTIQSMPIRHAPPMTPVFQTLSINADNRLSESFGTAWDGFIIMARSSKSTFLKASHLAYG